MNFRISFEIILLFSVQNFKSSDYFSLCFIKVPIFYAIWFFQIHSVSNPLLDVLNTPHCFYKIKWNPDLLIVFVYPLKLTSYFCKFLLHILSVCIDFAWLEVNFELSAGFEIVIEVVCVLWPKRNWKIQHEFCKSSLTVSQ